MPGLKKNHVARLCLWAALCLASIPVGHAQQLVLTVGGQPVQIPVPPQMRDVSNPEIIAFARKMVPATNRLLAVLLTADDHEKVQRGEAPVFERYVFVQTPTSTESQKVGSAQFDGIKTSMRRSVSAAVAGLRGSAGVQWGPELARAWLAELEAANR